LVEGSSPSQPTILKTRENTYMTPPGAASARSTPASIYPDRGRSEWILAQRPERRPVSPSQPHGFFMEQETLADRRTVSSGVVLLTNKECPWRCLMCDLWKYTLTKPVSPGAIPKQIEHALSRFPSPPQQIKLYNSGSFFDSGAIPVSDYDAIARQVRFASNVVVESHPRLVGALALEFRDLLTGSLEVAMGLETIHPEVLPRLNKGFTLGHFAEAAALLHREGIAVRTFVLVQPPFIAEPDAIEWTVRSAEFAFSCGAGAVSLIPTRPGNGSLEKLMQSGEFSPPTLATLERAMEHCLGLHAGRVFADTWALGQFSSCAVCLALREHRLTSMNLSQSLLPRIRCSACGAS
jgi:archaeosine synthase beta-subunit